MTTSDPGPFGQDPTPGVRLDRAPLLRVLCQVAWPEQTLLTAAFDDIADQIGIAVAEEYPTRELTAAMNIEFDSVTGQVRTPTAPNSRQWSSLDEHWMVYLTPRFVTLENRGHYTDRDDMIGRFERILGAVSRFAQIPAAQRFGWRYVNRISDIDEFADLDKLVHDSVRGAQVIPLPSEARMLHSLTNSLFQSASGNLVAKWGYAPPGATHDPSIEPATTPSWILDLDAYDDTRAPFSVDGASTKVRELASTAYNFFHWAVKPEFMTRFGGRA